MWKYECKKHLLIIVLASLIGALIFGVFGFERELIISTSLSMIEQMGNELPLEYVTMMKEMYQNNLFYYIYGALSIGGLTNGILIAYSLIKKYQVNYYIVLIIMMFAGSFIVSTIQTLGMVLLVPAMIICLYGMFTLPNKEARKNLKDSQTNSLSDFIHMYELHHDYDEKYEAIGKQYHKTTTMANILYIVGLVMAIGLIVVIARNTLLVMICVALYLVLYYYINKIKANAALPIRNILYNECNPIGCASAIIYASKKSITKTLVLTDFMAMSLIYLEDPSLAIDALSFNKQRNKQIDYTYHGLMAYAYYQLGDESMVKQHIEFVETPNNSNSRIQVINMMKIQTLEGMKAKLNMMRQNFQPAKAYYQTLLATLRFPCVISEVNYYLGLIAFVEQDFSVALNHFEYVVNHANTMFFKQKAIKFIEKLQAIINSQEQE